MKVKSTSIFALILLISYVAAQTPKAKTSKTIRSQIPSQSASVPGQLAGDDESVTAQATVRAGRDFAITVKTGGNGCNSKGDASLVLAEDGADIFVYDHTTATLPGTMCTMIYKEFEHRVTLRFAKKGEAVIRVWGRGAGDGPMGKPVIVEKRVTVK